MRGFCIISNSPRMTLKYSIQELGTVQANATCVSYDTSNE